MLLRNLVCLLSCAILAYCSSKIPANNTNEMDNLRIHLLTYNVNGKEPTKINSLFEFKTNSSIDVYAVTFQELPYSSYLVDSWKKQLFHVFGRQKYVFLAGESMSVTSLMIFVRKERIRDFYCIEKTYVNFDFFHRKGAIGIRFFWNNLTFCFIGCHFIPHDHNMDQRNENYHYILNRLGFNLSKENILSHDFVFWMGDLNYRINTLNFSEIKLFIAIAQNDSEYRKYQNLLNYDQLSQTREKRLAFDEFDEAPITFAPTYKFIVGSNNYTSERKPAYTDRILFRSHILSDPTLFIDYKSYSSLPHLSISDHKPVRLIANIPKSARIKKIELLEMSKNRSIKSKKSLHKIRNISKRAITSSNMNVDSGNFEGDSHVHSDELRESEEIVHENFHRKLYGGNSRRILNVDEPEQLNNVVENIIEPDEGTKISRKISIEFEPIHDWIENTPKSVRFRIVDRETGESIQPYPDLFTSVLSVWDYIGLLRDDWLQKDEYTLFVYPDFNFIEEAREAHILNDESDDSISDPEMQSSDSYNQPATTTSSLSSVGIQDETSHDDEQIVHRQIKKKKSKNNQNNDDEEYDNVQHEEYSYSATFGSENTIIAPGRYQLLYYRSNGDVLGISDPFEIIRNPNLPDFPE